MHGLIRRRLVSASARGAAAGALAAALTAFSTTLRQPPQNAAAQLAFGRRVRQTRRIPRLGQTIPALPVRVVSAAAAFYRERLGFSVVHEDGGFAIVVRDAAEIHLWGASDETWRDRDDLATTPVCSGAESFIAGTASCRVAVDGVDELFAELRASEVLHSRSTAVADTDYGTREFAVGDCDGNLISFYSRSPPRGG